MGLAQRAERRESSSTASEHGGDGSGHEKTLSSPGKNGEKSWVISYVPMFHITQPLDSMIGINGLFYGYYKVMSNIPKMGHLTTPENGGFIQKSTKYMVKPMVFCCDV